jgi:allantoin racemase
VSAERRILYQLVAPMEATLGVAEMERRRAFLQDNAAPGTVVSVRSVARGKASIESEYDAALVVPYIIESIEEAAPQIDAAIIGCFSDPGLAAARERQSLPVIGPGAAAIHLALQAGDRFSVLAPNAGSARSANHIRGMGLASRYASTRGVGLSVLELARDDGSALDRIADVGRACIEKDGADVLVFGRMSMAFLGLHSAIEARIGVPVVNPVIAGLKTAEMLLVHGLTHSRRAWPAPPDKPTLTRDTSLQP